MVCLHGKHQHVSVGVGVSTYSTSKDYGGQYTVRHHLHHSTTDGLHATTYIKGIKDTKVLPIP